MPIITPNSPTDKQFYKRLQMSGAAVIDTKTASKQDIRPARIGLLNLMPAATMEDTELRWMRFISHTVLQIEPVLIKFDNDFRERPGASREKILKRYTNFSAASSLGLDGLIITGDNQELGRDHNLLPFDKLLYGDQLQEVINWANKNVFTTIYSCLASHFALNYLHGLERRLSKDKIFGVYSHDVVKKDSALTLGIDDSIRAPHSRWGDVTLEHIEKVNQISLVAANKNVGWLLAEESKPDSQNFYIQGHPEYWRNDLHKEYIRDRKKIPENYYQDPGLNPKLTWANDARALHANWISSIYARFS